SGGQDMEKKKLELLQKKKKSIHNFLDTMKRKRYYSINGFKEVVKGGIFLMKELAVA
ncbi:MAG: hypothetical protein XD41_2055, partial [Desulfonauticus sp. 38_4375]